MATTTTPKMIKPLDGFTGVLDPDVLSRCTAVQTGMTGNQYFLNPPVDLAVLKTDIDSFSALIAEALDGSKKIIAAKNKQRAVVVKKVRLLGRHVEVTSDGDMAIFQTSGFQPASTTKAAPAPLPPPSIIKVTHGANSGQLVVQIKGNKKALSYELRYAAPITGGLGPWTSQLVPSVKSPSTVTGLTPGTIYAFQARAAGKLGYTDWSDSATCMAT